MNRGAKLVVVAAGGALLVACGGASSDPGRDALLQVPGAQFVPGAAPEGSASGPAVATITLPTTTIWPGLTDKSFSGALGPTAISVAVSLSGDRGYWILGAGPADFAAPTLPTFHGVASFAARLPPGAYAFQAQAVDANGLFGPRSSQSLVFTAAAPAAPPAMGALVVTLSWDTEADLDLHIVDPSGVEIFHGAPSSAPPLAGGSITTDAGGYGYLDFDSNAGCVIDGLRREDGIWPASPPSGTYLVRVDTPDLCGQSIAHYVVQVTLHGLPIGQASGVALDSDTWGPHDRGAGRAVLTFDVP